MSKTEGYFKIYLPGTIAFAFLLSLAMYEYKAITFFGTIIVNTVVYLIDLTNKL